MHSRLDGRTLTMEQLLNCKGAELTDFFGLSPIGEPGPSSVSFKKSNKIGKKENKSNPQI